MKNLVGVLFCGISFLFTSCENDDLSSERMINDGGKQANSDLFIINSVENVGFSAEELMLADFPKSDADFIIIPQTSSSGEVLSPFLSHPNLEKCFLLAGEFDNGKNAEAFFNSLDLYPEEETLQLFALNLKPNQIWLVRSLSGEFCKILIVETLVDKGTSYVEVRFIAEKV